MKAVVLPAPGKTLEIHDVPEPEAKGSDLVVQVKSCGICGSDLHASDGLAGGTVMGHEFSGEVVEVGPDSKSIWKTGDRVCALPMIGCGHCGACIGGDPSLCKDVLTTGLGQVPGAYAEFVRVGGNEALRLPDAIDFRDGALVEPLSVGLHAVNAAGLKSGENVLIVGAGPVGLAVALWCRFFGARAVIVSELAEGRRAMAGKFGATDVIDPSSGVVAAEFDKLAGAAPDVIFECVGVPGLLQQCIMMAPARSRIMVVGVCTQPDTIIPVLAIIKELTLKFVVAYRKGDFQMTIDMLHKGRIEGNPMVTDIVGFDDFAAAFQALKTPTTQCKVILEP